MLMLGKLKWPERACTLCKQMATSGEDYFMGNDLDAILDLLEEDIPEENEDCISSECCCCRVK